MNQAWMRVVLAVLALSILGPLPPTAAFAGVAEADYDYDPTVVTYDDAASLAPATVADAGRSSAFERPVADASGPSVALSAELVAPRAASALEDASQAAFRAADNIDDFAVPLKHQPWASGNYARFAEGVDQQGLIAQALRSDGAMFLANNRPGSFRVVYDFGQAIGARGETALRIVVGNDGRIWTAFPVKP